MSLEANNVLTALIYIIAYQLLHLHLSQNKNNLKEVLFVSFDCLFTRDAVCIFYLVLRALDTIEDDPTINSEEKTYLLTNFYTFLDDPEWRYMKSMEKDRIVLEDFPVVCSNVSCTCLFFRCSYFSTVDDTIRACRLSQSFIFLGMLHRTPISC